MSAYIVDNRTINRIIAGFETHGYPIGIAETGGNLGNHMRAINEKAVIGRYGTAKPLPGTYDENGNLIPYQYQAVMPDPKIQFLKSLRCFCYQCAEDATEGELLLGKLEEYSYHLAMDIIAFLPEYDQAAWG